MVNHHHREKICSVSKKVSDTKMYKIDNCGKKERANEVRGLNEGGVFLGTMRNTPRFRKTSFCVTTLFLSYEALSLV